MFMTLKKDKFKNLIAIDLEASGLHDGSFPIELGYTTFHMETTSFLIKPLDKWKKDEYYENSEKIHNIPYEMLLSNGKDPIEIANKLNTEFQGKIFTLKHMEYFIFDLENILSLSLLEMYEKLEGIVSLIDKKYKHTHRAGDDSLRLMSILKSIVDEDYYKELVSEEIKNA